jgi:hypothetical protein
MAIKKAKSRKTIEIDLRGPQGNAFYLLGFASEAGKKMGMSQTEINQLLGRMKSSDYENLLKEFDNTFGHFVTLYR